MKSKLTEKRAYNKPSLKTHGSVEKLTKGGDGPVVGSIPAGDPIPVEPDGGDGSSGEPPIFFPAP